jgi:sugar phosphate isomerase/epimerase
VSQPLAVQLYTVREALREDLPGTLRRVRDIGFRHVELFDYSTRVDEYAAALAEAELSPSSGHADLLTDAPDETLHASARLNVGTVIAPHSDEAMWGSRDAVVTLAQKLSEVARRASDLGLRIGYHNHAFEFENQIDDAASYEVFVDALSDDVVLELDIYWCEVGGQSAVDLLQRLGDRVQFLHVKDGPITEVTVDQTAVGRGSMPVAEILRTAPQALRVIELDDCSGDIFNALAESYTFLSLLED